MPVPVPPEVKIVNWRNVPQFTRQGQVVQQTSIEYDVNELGPFILSVPFENDNADWINTQLQAKVDTLRATGAIG